MSRGDKLDEQQKRYKLYKLYKFTALRALQLYKLYKLYTITLIAYTRTRTRGPRLDQREVRLRVCVRLRDSR